MPETDLLADLSAALDRHGMALRGGFGVVPADNLPDLAPARPVRTLILVGNVGGESIRAEFFVREGQTTFVEVRTQQ